MEYLTIAGLWTWAENIVADPKMVTMTAIAGATILFFVVSWLIKK